MAQIAWTSEALRWLEDIFEYIAADHPDAASRTVEGIFERAQALAQYPELGHRYRHYRIAYLVKEGGNVDVLGVFHGALDITKYQL